MSFNIYNQTSCENIEKARMIVMKHFRDAGFLSRVAEIERFNHSSDSGALVTFNIIGFTGNIYLRHYRPWNPWTRAIAYAELPNIYFNQRKNFPVMDRVETIAHECLHLLGYSHKGNYVTKYNLATVPYAVSRMFKEYVSEIYERV